MRGRVSRPEVPRPPSGSVHVWRRLHRCPGPRAGSAAPQPGFGAAPRGRLHPGAVNPGAQGSPPAPLVTLSGVSRYRAQLRTRWAQHRSPRCPPGPAQLPGARLNRGSADSRGAPGAPGEPRGGPGGWGRPRPRYRRRLGEALPCTGGAGDPRRAARPGALSTAEHRGLRAGPGPVPPRFPNPPRLPGAARYRLRSPSRAFSSTVLATMFSSSMARRGAAGGGGAPELQPRPRRHGAGRAPPAAPGLRHGRDVTGRPLASRLM